MHRAIKVIGALCNLYARRRSDRLHIGHGRWRPVGVNDAHFKVADHSVAESQGEEREGDDRHANREEERKGIPAHPPQLTRCNKKDTRTRSLFSWLLPPLGVDAHPRAKFWYGLERISTNFESPEVKIASGACCAPAGILALRSDDFDGCRDHRSPSAGTRISSLSPVFTPFARSSRRLNRSQTSLRSTRDRRGTPGDTYSPSSALIW